MERAYERPNETRRSLGVVWGCFRGEFNGPRNTVLQTIAFALARHRNSRMARRCRISYTRLRNGSVSGPARSSTVSDALYLFRWSNGIDPLAG